MEAYCLSTRPSSAEERKLLVNKNIKTFEKIENFLLNGLPKVRNIYIFFNLKDSN